MENAYKMLEDLTRNSRASIGTALNFINSLPAINECPIVGEGNADIRFRAKQIAQDLNIEDVLARVQKSRMPLKVNTGQLSGSDALPKKTHRPASSDKNVAPSRKSRVELYSEATEQTRRLEEEIREQVIADRARELAERQRIHLEEEARIRAEKERERTMQLIAEQKEACRMEALEKCATMMARRRQIVLATQLLVRWKAHIRLNEHNEAVLARRFHLYLLGAALSGWQRQYKERQRVYEEERQKLKKETHRSRLTLAETNYVAVLMRKTLLAMRMEAVRRGEERRQEEQRKSRKHRLESFIQRLEITQSHLSQSGAQPTFTSEEPKEEPAPRPEPDVIPSQKSNQRNKKPASYTPSTKRLRFSDQQSEQELGQNVPANLPAEVSLPTAPGPVSESVAARKLARKAPTQYVDFSKKAAERKQERLRKLEEERLAKEEAEQSKRLLMEELARQKARIRREQLEIAESHHAYLLTSFGYRALLRFHRRICMWQNSCNTGCMRRAFLLWADQTREKAKEIVNKIRRADAIVARVLDEKDKRVVFADVFMQLLHQAGQKRRKADRLAAQLLMRRCFAQMREYVLKVDLADKERGTVLRSIVIRRVVIFAWRRILIEFRNERRAEARQQDIYKLMRAQIAPQWEELVERLVLESFNPLYSRAEPVVHSFAEVVDVGALECLAERALYTITHLQTNEHAPLLTDSPVQPSVQLVVRSPPPEPAPAKEHEPPAITEPENEEMDFVSISELIAAARQLTTQTAARTVQPEFTYDFSAAESRLEGISAYIADQSTFFPVHYSAGESNQ